MRGDDFNARGGYPVEVFARRFQVLWLALFTDIVLLNTMPARVELTAHNTIERGLSVLGFSPHGP